MNVYSAELLFQWKPRRGATFRRRRVCEERIVIIRAATLKSAIAKAKKYGASEEFDHETKNGWVWFEFLGVKDIIKIDSDALAEEVPEVFHRFVEMTEPDVNREKILNPEVDLLAQKRGQRKSKLRAW